MQRGSPLPWLWFFIGLILPYDRSTPGALRMLPKLIGAWKITTQNQTTAKFNGLLVLEGHKKAFFKVNQFNPCERKPLISSLETDAREHMTERKDFLDTLLDIFKTRNRKHPFNAPDFFH
ncbi:MAG: hypothetical protein ACQEQ0_06135 [Bacteroidota bacterium]